MKDIIVFSNLILGIISGIVGLISSIIGIKTESAKGKKRKTFIFAMGLILLVSVLLIVSVIFNFRMAEEVDDLKVQIDARHILTEARDHLYELLYEYTEIIDETGSITSMHRFNELQTEAFKLYNSIYVLEEAKLDLGLKIFKQDNIGYVAVLIASTESLVSNIHNAISWADTSIHAINKNLLLLKEARKLHQELDGSDLNRLITWISSDQVYFRMRYLYAWSLAIQFFHRDVRIRISDIESQINQINSSSYLSTYPIYSNYHFNRLKEEFRDEFKAHYFNSSAEH